MDHMTVTRALTLPDRQRLARYQKAPELGPRVLFFSGGSALKDICQPLVRHTHNSIHLITPFDSGGSSATIRDAFKMLAVGDLRNRLMALADRSFTGNPQIFDLFAFRFPKDGDPAAMHDALLAMAGGRGELIRQVPEPMRTIIRSHLGSFLKAMPATFDLRGASIGNLILAGGFLNFNRQIAPVIYLFSKLVEVRGTVLPVSDENLHLVAELEDGRLLVGQHQLTGKEGPNIDARVRRLHLAASRRSPELEAAAEAGRKVEELIRQADLICYPVGSFYSSIIANLLPHGVARATAETDCPKIFTPNTYPDPEQYGMSLADTVETLVRYLQAGCPHGTPPERLLGYVMLDLRHGNYGPAPDLARIERLGVRILDVPLVSPEHSPRIDPDLYVESLLSLA